MTAAPRDPALQPEAVATVAPRRATLRGHLRIMRVDHWFKNVFVLPGVVIALAAQDSVDWGEFAWRLVVGMIAVCIVASSNYVLNEVLDAPYDIEHPVKRNRPVPMGLVNVRLAYAQWIALMLVGVGLGAVVSPWEALTLFGLWVAGCVYNIPPLRTKDVAYLDVVTEAVNNPIRMLVGWFIVAASPVPPLSLLVSYWMIGCYFMALKRFAEYRDMADARAGHVRYRRSFARYDDKRLLVSIVFYGSTAMLLFGAFTVRYRLELILAFPLIALIMAMYLNLAFEPGSPVEHPEKLYRERGLMVAVVACSVLMLVLLFVDVPWLADFFPRGFRLQ
jgi:decaprenyl-phosphate phosphoribosyltransferase